MLFDYAENLVAARAIVDERIINDVDSGKHNYGRTSLAESSDSYAAPYNTVFQGLSKSMQQAHSRLFRETKERGFQQEMHHRIDHLCAHMYLCGRIRAAAKRLATQHAPLLMHTKEYVSTGTVHAYCRICVAVYIVRCICACIIY